MRAGKRPLYVLALVTLSAVSAGCASTNVSRFQMPGTDLSALENVRVTRPAQGSPDFELHRHIVTELEKRGLAVVSGSDDVAGSRVDAVFNYKADWHWDITTYLLELRVALYAPDDGTLIAQAQSLQTSLVRKSNEEVVARAVAKLFDEPNVTNGEN